MAILRLRPAPDRKECFVSALQTISALAEATPGCLESSLYRATGEDGVFLYFERWSSGEDLKRHLRTESYRKLLFLIELAADVPALSFYDVVTHRGMDAVSEAREQM